MPTFRERVAGMAVADELMLAPGRWLDLGHARLPYWTMGSGPDLVLVHGSPRDGRGLAGGGGFARLNLGEFILFDIGGVDVFGGGNVRVLMVGRDFRRAFLYGLFGCRRAYRGLRYR